MALSNKTANFADITSALRPFVESVVGASKFKVQGSPSTSKPNYPLCTFYFLNPRLRFSYGNHERSFQSVITLTIWSTDYLQCLNLTEQLRQVLTDQFNRLSINKSTVSIENIADSTSRPQTSINDAQVEYGVGFDITFIVDQPYDDSADAILEINTQQPTIK